jgi:hypothetical protein
MFPMHGLLRILDGLSGGRTSAAACPSWGLTRIRTWRASLTLSLICNAQLTHNRRALD